MPERESQIRPLLGLTPEQAESAWKLAVERAGGRRISARLVKYAIKELKLAAPPRPVSQQNRQTRQTKAENDA